MDSIDKNKVVNYIYEKIHLYTHKFIKIERNENLLCLKDKKHYITPNFCGISSLLIFLKHEQNFGCYLVDRRTLSFEKTKLNVSNVRIKNVKINVDIKLYDGSIFDCVVIDETEDIIINDVFYYCSKNMLAIDYKNKMLLLRNFNYKTDRFKIFISLPYDMHDYLKLFTEYIKINCRKMNIRGIAFYPEKSGTKLIYVFNKMDTTFRDNLINNINDIVVESKDLNVNVENEPKKEITYFTLKDIHYNKDIILTFEVLKTDICDVYELYAYHDEKLIKHKIGLAYVHSYDLSLKCKKMFEDKNIQNIKCFFNKNNKKWIMREKTDEDITVLKNQSFLNYEIKYLSYDI